MQEILSILPKSLYGRRGPGGAVVVLGLPQVLKADNIRQEVRRKKIAKWTRTNIMIWNHKSFWSYIFLFFILLILNSVRAKIKVANLKKICFPLSINF